MLLTFLLHTLQVKIGENETIDTNDSPTKIEVKLRDLKPTSDALNAGERYTIGHENISRALDFINQYANQDAINLVDVKQKDLGKLAKFLICLAAMFRINDDVSANKQDTTTSMGMIDRMAAAGGTSYERPKWEDPKGEVTHLTEENNKVFMTKEKNSFISILYRNTEITFEQLRDTWGKIKKGSMMGARDY